MRCIILFLIYFGVSEGKLWSKGVVHYAINPKDYDMHSQDEIVSTFSALEKEICVKFFNAPFNENGNETQMVLYISNPNKQKNCPPQFFNYTGSVVNMTIGYKCINKNDIARMTMDMLKASIDPRSEKNTLAQRQVYYTAVFYAMFMGGTVLSSPINSYDLLKRFEERDQAKPRPTFLTTNDRNFINVHYHSECSMLSQRAYVSSARRSGDYEVSLNDDNLGWYQARTWPYGVVMYSVDKLLRGSSDYNTLRLAMSQIELTTCVVFHEAYEKETVLAKNQLVFKTEGADEPELGFKEGVQEISLSSMTHGDPGHNAHTLNNLMRAMGIPMMSNRYDRDNYIDIQWWFVKKGKERLLEKTPKAAWVTGIPYDFNSVTHAPANYLCEDCPPGRSSVEPLQDVLWTRSIHMGHHNKLSDGDVILVGLAYEAQCKAREESSVRY